MTTAEMATGDSTTNTPNPRYSCHLYSQKHKIAKHKHAPLIPHALSYPIHPQTTANGTKQNPTSARRQHNTPKADTHLNSLDPRRPQSHPPGNQTRPHPTHLPQQQNSHLHQPRRTNTLPKPVHMGTSPSSHRRRTSRLPSLDSLPLRRPRNSRQKQTRAPRRKE